MRREKSSEKKEMLAVATRRAWGRFLSSAPPPLGADPFQAAQARTTPPPRTIERAVARGVIRLTEVSWFGGF